MPPKVLPLAFVLFREPRLTENLYNQLDVGFWPLLFKSEAVLFDTTSYYDAEFGSPLYRHLIAFRALADPSQLTGWKITAATLEKKSICGGKRQFNLDVGYLDTDKLVLASFKPSVYKIYMGSGVYADIVATYSKGKFTACPWTFADFKDGRYQKALISAREKLKGLLKQEVEMDSVE